MENTILTSTDKESLYKALVLADALSSCDPMIMHDNSVQEIGRMIYAKLKSIMCNAEKRNG